VPYNPKRTLIPGRGPLARVPPIAAFLLVAAIFALGVWLRGPLGALLLGVLVVGVLALLAATWRLLDTGARVLRVVVVVVLVAIAISVLPG
jgi:hypothetical protein